MDNQVIKVLNAEHGKKVIKYWKDKGIATEDNLKGIATEDNGDRFCYYGVVNGKFDNFSFDFVIQKKAEIIELPSDFVLPKNWVIRAVPNICELVFKYFNDGCKRDGKSKYDNDTMNYFFHYPCFQGAEHFNFGEQAATAKRNTYTEITPEQFIKYVLKETTMPTREITPIQAQRIIDIACDAWKNKLAQQWSIDIVLNHMIQISEEFYQEMRKACTVEQNLVFDEIFGKGEEIYPDGTPCLVKNTWIGISYIVHL